MMTKVEKIIAKEIEDAVKKARKEATKETTKEVTRSVATSNVLALLKEGDSVEKIARCITDLSKDEIEELAKTII